MRMFESKDQTHDEDLQISDKEDNTGMNRGNSSSSSTESNIPSPLEDHTSQDESSEIYNQTCLEDDKHKQKNSEHTKNSLNTRTRPKASTSTKKYIVDHPVALSKNVTAFLVKLYNMVGDPTTDLLIGWSQQGTSFLVYDHQEFARQVLPMFFKHNNFASFVRQLNMYGFHKLPVVHQGIAFPRAQAEVWEFTHPKFKENRPELLCLMHRKKTKEQPDLVPHSPNINKVLVKINALKNHQLLISKEIKNLREDYKDLYSRSIEMSNRHQNQQEKIDKIIKFIARLYSFKYDQVGGVMKHKRLIDLDINNISPQSNVQDLTPSTHKYSNDSIESSSITPSTLHNDNHLPFQTSNNQLKNIQPYTYLNPQFSNNLDFLHIPFQNSIYPQQLPLTLPHPLTETPENPNPKHPHTPDTMYSKSIHNCSNEPINSHPLSSNVLPFLRVISNQIPDSNSRNGTTYPYINNIPSSDSSFLPHINNSQITPHPNNVSELIPQTPSHYLPHTPYHPKSDSNFQLQKVSHSSLPQITPILKNTPIHMIDDYNPPLSSTTEDTSSHVDNPLMSDIINISSSKSPPTSSHDHPIYHHLTTDNNSPLNSSSDQLTSSMSPSHIPPNNKLQQTLPSTSQTHLQQNCLTTQNNVPSVESRFNDFYNRFSEIEDAEKFLNGEIEALDTIVNPETIDNYEDNTSFDELYNYITFDNHLNYRDNAQPPPTNPQHSRARTQPPPTISNSSSNEFGPSGIE